MTAGTHRIYVTRAVALFLTILWLPTFALLLASVHAGPLPQISFVNFSLTPFYHAIVDPLILRSFSLSLTISIPVGLIGSAAGWLIAAQLATRTSKFNTIVCCAVFVPLLIPANVLSLALLEAIHGFNEPLGAGAIVFGHALLFIPLGFVFHAARVHQLDASLIAAGHNLGAHWWKIFWQIYWPHQRNVFLAGAMVICALSIDEPTISFYLADTERPLAVRITQMMQSSFDPTLQAAAVLVLLLTILLIIAGGLIEWRAISRGSP